MKKAIISLFLCAASFAFAQTVGVLNGPSGIPCAKLISEKSKNNFSFETFASAQNELPKLLKGEIDIGFLPPNAAAKAFTASNKSIVCLGIAGNGNIYLLTKRNDFTSLKDLAEKTVACAGQGATPEYVLRYLLRKNGLKTSDATKSKKAVSLSFSTPNPQIAPALIEGKFDYALVPEPFATVAQAKDPTVKRVLALQDEFKRKEKIDTFPMTLLVANAKYAKENPEKIASFIAEYERASAWTQENPAEAGALAEKENLGLQASIAAKAIPNAAYTWKSAKAGRGEIERLLSIFLGFAPESVGGALPSEEFYY